MSEYTYFVKQKYQAKKLKPLRACGVRFETWVVEVKLSFFCDDTTENFITSLRCFLDSLS